MAKTKFSLKKEEMKVTGTKEVKVESKVTSSVDLMNPAFDPDIPEQKQRHFR